MNQSIKLPPTSFYQQQYLEHLPTARKAAAEDTAKRLPPPAQQQAWISFYNKAASSKGGPLSIGLQHELVQDAEKAQRGKLADKLSAEKRYFELAHKIARTGRWAAAAWTTFPWEPAQSFPSQQFRLVTRTRLELPPLNQSQPRCQKCKANLRGQQAQYHGLHCNNSRRIFGHDQVVQALKAVIRSASGASIVEPREIPGWGDGRHPDLEVQMGAMSSLIDVTVVDPLAASYFQGVAKARAPGTTAQKAEHIKKNKYDALARAQHCTFFPFAVETLGTFGEGAVKFLETLATHHSEYLKDGLTRQQFLSHAASSIAVAVNIHGIRGSREVTVRSHRLEGAVMVLAGTGQVPVRA